MNKIIYTALSDGTHIHHKLNGEETFCTQKHPKKLPPFIWLTVGVAITEFILIIMLLNKIV